jgi:hypothetical protein
MRFHQLPIELTQWRRLVTLTALGLAKMQGLLGFKRLTTRPA